MGRSIASIASNALTLLIVVLAAVAALLAWGRSQYVGPGPLSQPICLRVEKGTTVSALSRSLLAQGAISSDAIFRIGAGYSGKSALLKFGSYMVPAAASMTDILDEVTKSGQNSFRTDVNFRIGILNADVKVSVLDPATKLYKEAVSFNPATDPVPPEYHRISDEGCTRFRVTLAEGVTGWQVVESLKRASFLTGDIARVPDEGSLAPASYEVASGDARQTLLAKMEKRQATTLADLWGSRAGNLPYKTPEEALVMASLVEKETGVAGERAKVASVFVNRLDKRIRLQTDPAVIYGITKGVGSLGRGLRQSELKRKTPYNTYVIDRLPPTPICNPGRNAIDAALHPASTGYLYFVADGSGGHAFAATLAEHNQNVAKWRALEAQRQKEQ